MALKLVQLGSEGGEGKRLHTTLGGIAKVRSKSPNLNCRICATLVLPSKHDNVLPQIVPCGYFFSEVQNFEGFRVGYMLNLTI